VLKWTKNVNKFHLS